MIALLLALATSVDAASHAQVLANKSASSPSASPTGAVIPTITPDPVKILDELFKLLGVTGVDTVTCVKDVSGAGHFLRDFADDLETKNYTQAVSALGRGISALSSSVNDCGVQQIQSRLDALAASIKWANISTAGFDKVVQILVSASDMEKDIEGLAAAIRTGDASQIGTAIQTLLNDWTSITGGCDPSSKACNFIDGILKVVMTIAQDIQPCEAAIEPAIANLTYGATLFKNKDYKDAIASMALGLDELSQALSNDACGLKKLADVISQLSPKLAKAVVKIESSNVTQIIVEFADVYDEIYQAVEALESGDISQFGMQIGRLLTSLRASGCQSKACVVVEGLLGIVQLEAGDFAECSGDLDRAWQDVETALIRMKDGEPGQAVGYLAQGISMLAKAVQGCDLEELGSDLEQLAIKLGGDSVAQEIGKVISVIVEGADITDALAAAAQDYSSKRWSALGTDLSSLADQLSSDHCSSVVCKIVDGLLHMAGTALQDLVPCEQDLYAARAAFIQGGKDMGEKNIGSAVQSWAQGLNDVAKAVGDCGISDEIKYIEQEANVFGFANVSTLGVISQVLVHGADVYQDMFATLQAFEAHDYRGAGQSLGKVMNELSQWTEGHACTSDICYVVIGVVQFLDGAEGSFKQCENDLKTAWTDFGNAVHEFNDSHESVIFHWKHDKSAIKAGIKDLGDGFTQIANSVTDCHMQELADLLEKLAVKLGIEPEISWLEEILHILIEGVNIEKEIGAACTDYGEGNWVGFGYNLAKLIKTLV